MSELESVRNPLKFSIIDLIDFKSPAIPLEAKVKQSFKNFLANLKKKKKGNEIYKPYDELTAFSRKQIDQIVPYPDWLEELEELDDFAEKTEKINHIFIDLPFSGTANIVEKWVSLNGYKILTPPKYNQIIAPGFDYEFDPNENIAVIHLEKWFLRHYQGINFIESFIEKLASHKGNLMIVCHSWTWNFLTNILSLNFSHFSIKTFQSLNFINLQIWIHNLVSESMKRKMVYRLADSGNLIFKENYDALRGSENNGKTKSVKIDFSFMKNVVGYSLGLPLICWHIWRNCLRKEPDEEFQTLDDTENQYKQFYTIWVTPWEDYSLPRIPQDLSTAEKMILHSINLHNGLPGGMIASLLDLNWQKAELLLKKLSNSGIIYKTLESDNYEISANAYPKVKEFLNQSGYLTDGII